MSASVNLQQEPMWSNREATKINVALGKIGYPDADVTCWWNERSFPELSGMAPTQAWNRNEFDRVKALVEKIISLAFAEQLPDNPIILKRLEESKQS
jgi:hypothetical protein